MRLRSRKFIGEQKILSAERIMRLKDRAAYFGVFTALALIFSYIETLIPIQFGVPGVKLGLANLIIVIALFKTDWREALLLSVVRIILAGFIFGNLFGIIYSLAGGIPSLAVMALLKRADRLSVVGVSMAGGVCHNIGQLIVAMIVVETYQVGYYLPVLLIAGLITGTVIGVVAAFSCSGTAPVNSRRQRKTRIGNINLGKIFFFIR